MTDGMLLAAGAVSGFLGFVNLDDARRRDGLRATSLFWAVLAGYAAADHADLRHADGALRLAWWGLAFHAASPLLAVFLWGRDGAILRGFGRVLFFLTTSLVAFLAWRQITEIEHALILGLATGALTLLPWRTFRSKLRGRRAAQHRRDEERRRKDEMREEEARKRRLEDRQEELLQAMIEDLRK